MLSNLFLFLRIAVGIAAIFLFFALVAFTALSDGDASSRAVSGFVALLLFLYAINRDVLESKAQLNNRVEKLEEKLDGLQTLVWKLRTDRYSSEMNEKD